MANADQVYGLALYRLAREEGIAEEILRQLTVLDESFHREPGFLQLLSSPFLPKEERCRIPDRLFRGRIHPYILNFLKILSERSLVNRFSGCCLVYRQQYNQDQGILPVTAVTALPLSDALRRKLIDKLSHMTGKQIELTCKADPGCLGGIRLEWDGKQIDGTLRRRLEEIRHILNHTVL